MFRNLSNFKSNGSQNLAVSQLKEERRQRFRVLVCLDGSVESLEGVRLASKIKPSHDCDIILLYVRTIDQGL